MAAAAAADPTAIPYRTDFITDFRGWGQGQKALYVLTLGLGGASTSYFLYKYLREHCSEYKYILVYAFGDDSHGTSKIHSTYAAIRGIESLFRRVKKVRHDDTNRVYYGYTPDPDIHNEINQQVLYHGDGSGIQINRGDPFVLYIPYERKSKLGLEIRAKNNEDDKLFRKKDVDISSKFPPNGLYRKWQRARDKSL